MSARTGRKRLAANRVVRDKRLHAAVLLTIIHAYAFLIVGTLLLKDPLLSWSGAHERTASALASGENPIAFFRKTCPAVEIGVPCTLAAAIKLFGERLAYRAYRFLNFLVATLGILLFYFGCLRLTRGSQTKAILCSGALAIWPLPAALAKGINSYGMATAWMMVFYGILTMFFGHVRQADEYDTPLSRLACILYGLALGACVGLASTYRSQPYLLGAFFLPALCAYIVLCFKDWIRSRRSLLLLVAFLIGQGFVMAPTLAFNALAWDEIRVRRQAFWHTVASGLGMYEKNTLGMPCWDKSIAKYVASIDPAASSFGPYYESVLKKILTRHMLERPEEFVKAAIIRTPFLFVDNLPFMRDYYSTFGRIFHVFVFLLSFFCIIAFLRGSCPEALPLIACMIYFYLSVVVIFLPAWPYVIHGTLAGFPMVACLLSQGRKCSHHGLAFIWPAGALQKVWRVVILLLAAVICLGLPAACLLGPNMQF